MEVKNSVKKNNHNAWFWIIVVTLLLIGGAIIFAGTYCGESKLENIFLSIGTSIVASAIATIYFKIYDNYKDKDIDEKFEELQSIFKNTLPEERVYFGRHLRNVFTSDMLEKYRYRDAIKIDVLGLELYHFYNDQFNNLQRYKNMKMRLIVQNPCSKCFSLMIRNEARNYITVVNNIIKLTEDIKKYNDNITDEDEKIEVFWLDYPSSVTITRVEDIMYVRPRFLKEGEGEEDIFFEKYTSEVRNFRAYTNYFDNAIKISKNPYENNCKLINDAKMILENSKSQEA